MHTLVMYKAISVNALLWKMFSILLRVQFVVTKRPNYPATLQMGLLGYIIIISILRVQTHNNSFKNNSRMKKHVEIAMM
jgi:hypothetical protein